MTDRPLTELQRRVLRALAALEDEPSSRRFHRYSFTPNEIGSYAKTKLVVGRGYRVFGAAQQIIPTLTSLRKRGLIDYGRRDDDRSGTSYYLTSAGEKAAREVAR